MSFRKAVKWFAIYVLLTLGFAAVTALTTFIFVAVMPYRYEFSSLFFFFLFLTGLFLFGVGALSIIRTHLITSDLYSNLDWIIRWRHLRTERKDGILLMLTGLTFILVSLTQF